MKILEFRHIGPFDGCFHRWEYLALDSSIDSSEAYPIVFTPGRLSLMGIVDLAIGLNVTSRNHDLFTKFKWYDWGSEIFQEIPHNYEPAFWEFAQRHNLKFVWECDECGREQTDKPIHMASYRGNGGIGIEVEGWLCEDCEHYRFVEEEN